MLLKYNPTGGLIWNFTWGTTYLDRPEDIYVDEQNDIYIAGYTKSPDAYEYDRQKIVVLKVNTSGGLEWLIQEDFGTKGERALGIALTSNNDIIVCGYQHVLGTTGREMLIIKYDSSGNQIWNNTWGYGSTHTVFGNDVVLDNSDNIYVSGFDYPGGDAILVRFDSDGQYIWTKSWSWSKDWGMAIDIDNSSSYLYTSGYSRDNGMFLLKYDLNGNLIDEVSGFGGICPEGTYTESQKLNDTIQLRLDIDSRNNIYISTFSGIYTNNGNDLLIYKFNSSLDMMWEKTWAGDNDDYGFCVDTDIERNQIVIGGKTYSETDGASDALILFNPYSPYIKFSLNENYLNTTIPLVLDKTLEINCSVLNFTSMEWVYLSENSTGTFVNRTMQLGINSEWFYPLDITGLTKGDYVSFSFYAKDSDGNLGTNNNEGGNFELRIGDLIPPETNIAYQISEAPNTVSKSTTFTLSAEDIGERVTGINNISYRIDDGVWKEYSDSFSLSGYSHGLHNISYFATDNAGNLEEIQLEEIFLDIKSPNITFHKSKYYLSTISPQYNDTTLQINCSVSDDTSISWVYLNENSTGTYINHTMSMIHGNYSLNLDISSLHWLDSFCFSFYSIDSTGNLKWKNNGGLNYSLQIYDPYSPTTNLSLQLCKEHNIISNSTEITLTSDDHDLQASGISNITYQIDSSAWEVYSGSFTISGYSHGEHTISYFSTDNAGNTEEIQSIQLFLDLFSPNITITNPINNAVYNGTAPYYEINITDDCLEDTWYTFNSSERYPLESEGRINQTVWSSMEDRPICISFYANDSCGHLSTEKITLIKDSNAPELTILFPHDQDLLGINPPEFVVEILDPHKELMWYSFNGGITNIFFEENTTFALSEWEKYSESVNITFYANDSVGNIISKEISLLKDIENPEITINDPIFNQ
ncbi:MAG: hypothetical protein GF364_17710, partial [Candidatus Lokiarchaeota archaeon]|nr:hypothetical protein [Candidatus Lokiarchaeota archaeon]